MRELTWQEKAKVVCPRFGAVSYDLTEELARIEALTGGGTFPSGGIIMWSGAIAAIPSGWLFCDGTNGTPDLRDRMIIGAKQDEAGVAKTNVSGALTQSGGAGTHSHAAHSNHAVTQPGGHSNHVFTQPSAHANHLFTQPTNHVFTQPGAHAAHVFTQPGAHSAHVFTQPSNHANHTHTYTQVPNHVHIQSVGTAATGALVGYTYDATTGTSVSSGYSTANPTGGVATGTTANESAALSHSGGAVDAHSAHSGGAVDAHSAHAGGAVDAHSGAAVDAHSAHSGGAVDAHTAHSGTDVDAHSAHDSPSHLNPYYALALIMKV